MVLQHELRCSHGEDEVAPSFARHDRHGVVKAVELSGSALSALLIRGRVSVRVSALLATALGVHVGPHLHSGHPDPKLHPLPRTDAKVAKHPPGIVLDIENPRAPQPFADIISFCFRHPKPYVLGLLLLLRLLLWRVVVYLRQVYEHQLDRLPATSEVRCRVQKQRLNIHRNALNQLHPLLPGRISARVQRQPEMLQQRAYNRTVQRAAAGCEAFDRLQHLLSEL